MTKSQSHERKVVARVNDTEITQGELDMQIAQLSRDQSIEIPSEEDTQAYTLFQKTALDQLIGIELLIMEARDMGIQVDDKAVTGELEDVIKEFGSEEAFEEQLSQSSITRDVIEQDIREQLLLTNYITNIQAEYGVRVTQEEVQHIYNEQIAPQEDAPSLEEVGPYIATQLEQQKVEPVLIDRINELRKAADIQIFLE